MRKPQAKRSLSHVRPSAKGSQASMVDVGKKPTTARSALARAQVRFPQGVLGPLLEQGGPKGPIEEISRAAGVLGAKRTSELIPLCHGLDLDHVQVEFEALDENTLEIRCQATVSARTGVEMEALVGAALAALTVYDMSKALDHGIVIERLELLEKRGGASGLWRASDSRKTRPKR